MNKADYKINRAYNLFLTQVIVWDCLEAQIREDITLGFNPVKTIERRTNAYIKASRMGKLLELEDLTGYKSYFTATDHKALVNKFLETLD